MLSSIAYQLSRSREFFLRYTAHDALSARTHSPRLIQEKNQI